MNEVWKDIKDYEGLYQVSNLGRIKRLKKITKWFSVNHLCERVDEEKILCQEKNTTGYNTVKLNKDGKTKKKNVHRLVAEMFIDNVKNKKTVNHKDGNKQNNCVENLEWATYGENNKHAYDVLKKKGAFCGKATPNSRKVIRLDTNEIFRSVRAAAFSVGVNQSSLCEALLRGVKCKNIEWRYV